jgi:hypothetical protein
MINSLNLHDRIHGRDRADLDRKAEEELASIKVEATGQKAGQNAHSRNSNKSKPPR